MGMVELLTLTVRSVFSKSGLTEFSLFFTVLILAVCAAYVARRSGVFLLAVDGALVCAASGAYFFAQFATAHLGEAGFVSMLAGVLGGLLGGSLCMLLTSWLIITAKGSDILVGVVINLAARQTSVVLMKLTQLRYAAERTLLPALHLGALEELPFIGPVFGNANLMTWLALVAPFAAYYLVNNTGFGLCLHAAEENPHALVGAGVELSRIQMLGMLAAGVFASLAGIACSMGAMPLRVRTIVPQGFGYLALVIVFAASGRLRKSCLYAVVLSLLGAMPQAMAGVPLSSSLVRCIVFVAAFLLILLQMTSSRRQMKRKVRAQRLTHAARKAGRELPEKFSFKKLLHPFARKAKGTEADDKNGGI